MLTPKSEVELADILRAAETPVRVQGGGTRGVGVARGEVLSTASLTGITLYEPGALTLVAKAGTPLSEITETLAAENQRLPFEPIDHRRLLGTKGEPTIGGAVATNASGPRRIAAGACRDSLIGVRFVDGAGTIVKNGGRVMKNVTGYDLVKLMAGSWGTLGVLTEVSFKVLPGVASEATLLLDWQTPDAAIKTLARALRSPFEVTGAAYVPEGPDGVPMTAIRLEGFEASVAYRADKLRTELGEVRIEDDSEKSARLWRDIRDASILAGAPADVWRISVRPSHGPRVAKALGEARLVMDWGGGLVWAQVAQGTDLRARLKGIPGHATLVRAAPETHARLGTFPPEPEPVARLTAGLRAKFDPRNILNTGLMAAPEHA
ncbi:glycolate oxidase FAD binding subunit [Palleronia aestuarii]|uniref:Glycolate oxidase FAD binding subunit n=1 Tax=Palleronia aestuarii TaxID=568105 RepID=A0A2W7NVH4_9RHOB|nr:FAD-binding protein [Palleronia aestuarii]PZX15222.1 glycolate oxidase FAD binding subunit [Palleronia aestuarii]